ncbi:FRG domain-containing protein [Vibrio coralliilyticus]|uniref:FRG domain-containing protein n=1 Tax=Vibrio coralliilyticus TaxID=190893 RepID=UPI00155F92E1|nr:FRG domain-containing protein [Vibrio coralliilyticus]NRF16336.1 FRG domain-containing protein [Vibrio coralliilyticus]
MKQVEHHLHGSVLKPESFSELLANVCEPSGEHQHRVWMWRGQSDIDWRLDSSAYRRLKNSSGYKPSDPNQAMISYEKTLLQHATHRGYRYENGKELSDFELLAKLQHHGAATRLVDFTRNALIGIWFACSENAQKSGLLVAFDTWYLEGYEKELEIRTYGEIVDDFRDDPITWESPSVSARITAQHSQFIYSKVMQCSSGSLAFPSDESAYRKFELTPELKEEALAVLFEVFDINKSNIFPDLDGFAQANSVLEDTHRMHRW